jgi:hypothetical protein
VGAQCLLCPCRPVSWLLFFDNDGCLAASYCSLDVSVDRRTIMWFTYIVDSLDGRQKAGKFFLCAQYARFVPM